MQIILGVFVMRTLFGFHLFKFLGKEIDKFLSYTDYGSRLVFGINHKDHFFAFKVFIYSITRINEHSREQPKLVHLSGCSFKRALKN